MRLPAELEVEVEAQRRKQVSNTKRQDITGGPGHRSSLADAASIPSGVAIVCTVTHTESWIGGKIVQKREPRRNPSHAVFTRDRAPHCTSNTCIDARAAGTVEGDNALYVSDRGERITSNVLALEIGGLFTVYMLLPGGGVTEAKMEGECQEVDEVKAREMMRKAGVR